MTDSTQTHTTQTTRTTQDVADYITEFDDSDELMESLEEEIGSNWFDNLDFNTAHDGVLVVGIPVWLSNEKDFDSAVVPIPRPSDGDYIIAETDKAILLDATTSSWNPRLDIQGAPQDEFEVWLPKSQINFIGVVPESYEL